jgi:hypothetical protein
VVTPAERDDVMETIVLDVLQNARSFLPGAPCQEPQLRANLLSPVLYDGLSKEESTLILSVLPRGASGIFVSPMDKGLSGAKVLQGRYPDLRGRLSKPFVIKLGPKRKILREAQAMQELVSPFIPGAVPPVYRIGPSQCLLVQELAGLSTESSVVSLRSYARTHPDTASVVNRLFAQRLQHWYDSDAVVPTSHMTYRQAFEWYLEKASSGSTATIHRRRAAQGRGPIRESPSSVVCQIRRLGRLAKPQE